MPGLLGKKWPVPVAGPMAPFYVAGAAVMYGINEIANAMMNSDEFRNDPRNPRAKTKKPADKH